ncbi:MAG: efflux RND transporter periplasmic adaptor subunit, partial [Acidobacteria bacterium]|nr:efflux RND transporter periplasmic adaptor subunit [Acidobacteriota bacterium]
RRKATVSSKITGKVVEILIEEGMEVQKGQVLARLDDSNVLASLALARAQLDSARSGIKETEVQLAESGRNLRRLSNLAGSGITSEANLDTAQADVDSLKARLETQENDIIVAQRQMELWEQAREDTIIRAPFAGVIVAKNAQPGEMISPISAGGFTRTGIGTLVDMSSLEIEVDVNESYIQRVTAGQRVIAILDAYPDWQIPSQVIAIIPTADRQRATVQVRVGFAELDARILPDMGVKVAFQDIAEDRGQEQGVLVPLAALRQGDEQDFVLVVAEEVIERRAVLTGAVRDDDILILSGLNPGEAVVISGPPDLGDGDSVKELRP